MSYQNQISDNFSISYARGDPYDLEEEEEEGGVQNVPSLLKIVKTRKNITGLKIT